MRYALEDPAAMDKIKMPRWDIFVLSWLGCAGEMRVVSTQFL